MTHEIIGSNRNLEELLDSGDLSAEELLRRIEEFKVPETPVESPVVKTKPEQTYEGLLPPDATETPYGSLTKIVEFYGYELVESDANVMKEFFDRALSNKSIESCLRYGKIRIENNRFVRVDFSNENLSEFFDGLGYLIGLQEVDFSYNFLSSLPDSVGNWKSLEGVKFRGNSLSALPDSVGNWKSLRGASFNHNSLSILPESVSDWEELKIAFFQDNPLSILPDSVGNWSKLKKAYFSNNSLSILPDSVSNWGQLEYANFNDNPLSILPDSVDNWKSLKRAFFQDNPLNNKSKKILDELKESTGANIIY